jgi:hypothetical protein
MRRRVFERYTKTCNIDFCLKETRSRSCCLEVVYSYFRLNHDFWCQRIRRDGTSRTTMIFFSSQVDSLVIKHLRLKAKPQARYRSLKANYKHKWSTYKAKRKHKCPASKAKPKFKHSESKAKNFYSSTNFVPRFHCCCCNNITASIGYCTHVEWHLNIAAKDTYSQNLKRPSVSACQKQKQSTTSPGNLHYTSSKPTSPVIYRSCLIISPLWEKIFSTGAEAVGEQKKARIQWRKIWKQFHHTQLMQIYVYFWEIHRNNALLKIRMRASVSK